MSLGLPILLPFPVMAPLDQTDEESEIDPDTEFQETMEMIRELGPYNKKKKKDPRKSPKKR